MKSGLARLGPLRIGPHTIDVPILLAPMAGVSEAPFRRIALSMGAGLAPTELVSAKGLEFGNARTEAYLRHDPEVEPILAVQVYGGEPSAMARAAEIAVERGARIIDVNMGCPVKKVTRHGAGSALMCDAARAAEIVAGIRARIGDGVPVTAKIRAGWDETRRNAPELARALEDAGLAAITVHPRTRQQGYSGNADWSLIGAVKRSVSIPVIANGDIGGVEAADRAVEETGCDAVMIGRAALGNPWIFRRLLAAHRGMPLPSPPAPAEKRDVLLDHLEALIEHVEDEGRAIKKFRQHIVWYSRGLSDAAVFRERVMGLIDRERVSETVDEFFSRARLTNLDEAPIYDERMAFG